MALPSTIQAILTRFRGTNNNAYNATSNPLGMGQGGHRQNFAPRLKDTADVLDWMSGAVDAVDADAQATAADRVQTGQDRTATAASAGAAAQSVTDAAGQVTLAAAQVGLASEQVTLASVQAQRLQGTSTSSITPSVAGKIFTTQAGKAFDVGSSVLVQSRGSVDRWMSGRVTAYAGTSLTVAVDAIGSVTSAATDWDIRVSGARGAQGIQGIPGIATMPYVARASNTQIVAGNSATIFDLTGTFTQTFAACVALGANWYAVLRNAGTGDITLDPNGSETIDGLASFIMYPGEVRLIQCDGTALRSILLEAGTKTFNQSGNLTWPPGINGAFVECSAGGGGGGRQGGGGGGGGGQTPPKILVKSPGTVDSVFIGSAGLGATSSANATKGGDTSFGTIDDGCYAIGGSGGSNSTGRGGNGGGAGKGVGTTNGQSASGLLGAGASTATGGGPSWPADWGGGSGGVYNSNVGEPSSGGGSVFGGGGGGAGTTNSSNTGGGGRSGSQSDPISAGANVPSKCGGYGGNSARAPAPGGFPGGGGGGGGTGSFIDGANGAAGQVVVRFF